MKTNTVRSEWPNCAHRVEEEFLRVSRSVERVKSALHLLGQWMREETCRPQCDAVIDHILAGRYELLLDSFYQFIPFGTGGRRGRVGFGPNRINEVTVSLSVLGHCQYLHKEFPAAADLSVVVAFDVRIFKDLLGTYQFLNENPLYGLTSRGLAVIAAEIYAAHGIRCYFVDPLKEDGYLSTPELSFVLRRLGAHAGVNMSASHNHPDDNGFKFYNVHGAQDIPPFDETLAAYMNQFEPLVRLPFAQAVAQGLAQALPRELHEEYLTMNLALKRGTHPTTSGNGSPITYTPLCGTGRTTVEEVLRRAGHNVVVHQPDAEFDGTFPHIPFHLPNPEVPEAAWPATKTAEACKSNVVFSTDPDADRLGVLARDAAGKWHHLSGNEIAAILSYFMILDEKRGPKHHAGVVIKTLVTTALVERIAERGGCAVVGDLLIGFKYIAEVLRRLESEGRYEKVQARASDMILAVEESHGYLLTHTIRDKDAAGAALMLADLVYALDAEGRTLLDYLEEVMVNCGSFGNGARSILMRGMRGADVLGKMMDSLRSLPPTEIGAHIVSEATDFQKQLRAEPGFDANSSMAKSNDLLEFRTNGGRVIVRPSGTEPKIKIYSEAEAVGAGREEAKRLAGLLALDMYRVCLNRLGRDYELSAAAELIPDHIPLDVKRRFSTEYPDTLLKIAPELAPLERDAFLEALRKSLSEYVAEDPLKVFRLALIEICRTTQADAALASDLAAIVTHIAE